MNKARLLYFVLISFALAIALTLFYFVHESLPRVIRAPTSLILASIAIVDGLCVTLGISGIYGQLIPVFVVNLFTSAAACYAFIAMRRFFFNSKTLI